MQHQLLHLVKCIHANRVPEHAAPPLHRGAVLHILMKVGEGWAARTCDWARFSSTSPYVYLY